MHYTCHVDLAFASVEHIMRDVNNGWLVRYIHANGASMFFITIYVHMFKNLYYGSYAHPRAALWCSGVIIFNYSAYSIFRICFTMGSNESVGSNSDYKSCFCNSFNWYFNRGVVMGGFSVDNATLNRFFSFHYLFRS